MFFDHYTKYPKDSISCCVLPVYSWILKQLVTTVSNQTKNNQTRSIKWWTNTHTIIGFFPLKSVQSHQITMTKHNKVIKSSTMYEMNKCNMYMRNCINNSPCEFILYDGWIPQSLYVKVNNTKQSSDTSFFLVVPVRWPHVAHWFGRFLSTLATQYPKHECNEKQRLGQRWLMQYSMVILLLLF